MSTTVNGIAAFITSVRGTATYFIRTAVVNSVDSAALTQDETDGTTLAGYQTIFMGGTALGTDATGFANDATAYTMSVVVNGVTVPVSVVGSAAQTVTDLITELNTDLGANATAALTGGNIVITSDNAGNESYVVITDTDLVSSLTGAQVIQSSVVGGMQGAMNLTTLGNGTSAWNTYKQSVEVYDSASNKAVLASAYTPADLNATFSDTEVEGELAAIKTKLDALQSVVTSLVENSNNGIL